MPTARARKSQARVVPQPIVGTPQPLPFEMVMGYATSIEEAAPRGDNRDHQRIGRILDLAAMMSHEIVMLCQESVTQKYARNTPNEAAIQVAFFEIADGMLKGLEDAMEVHERAGQLKIS